MGPEKARNAQTYMKHPSDGFNHPETLPSSLPHPTQNNDATWPIVTFIVTIQKLTATMQLTTPAHHGFRIGTDLILIPKKQQAYAIVIVIA